MAPCPWPMSDLVPHAPPMVLLDEALEWDDESLLAAVTIRPGHPFMATEGVPVHVGIELMAQACGAHVGAAALAAGKPVRLGFLLGTRRFEAKDDWMRPGERIEVSVRMVLREDEMGVYDCRIERDGDLLAEASLTLYQPRDEERVAAILRGENV